MRSQPVLNIVKTLQMRFSLAALVLISFFALAVEAHADIPLKIQETLGIVRAEEMVHNGIPVAREEGWLSTDNLIVEDASGTQVPATFEVLSRWAGGKDDTNCPIQWLLLNFPASVGANGTANYFVRQGTPITRTNRVTVQNNADNYTIDTGAAQFVINKNNLTLFDAISLNSIQLTSGSGGSYSKIRNSPEVPGQGGAQPAAAANAPAITIERRNDHYLVIKAEGEYANTPLGFNDVNNNADHTKVLAYKIRYEFYAGSPTVIVYHKFCWPGANTWIRDWDGSIHTSNSRQIYIGMGLPIIVENVSLTLPALSAYTSTQVYADASTSLSGSLAGGESAAVAQRRRNLFNDPHVAEVTLGNGTTGTPLATQPMLINRSANGTLAVSIDHMAYFEPQSIRTNDSGGITVNVLAEEQYFATYQGAWARVGISALPADATYGDTLQQNYAPLNHRLFAFPTNAYTVTSEVLMEVPLTPNGSSDQRLQKYYTEMKEITDTTREYGDDEGLRGLMTWGSLPRYLSETGSAAGWDKIYSGATLADYHSGMFNVVHQFLLDGDPQSLYDLSFAGARRMLHTQIMQPDAERSESYMGWAPSGYQRYRQDFNSSHSYFENLYNYYYMTGDMEVIDVLKVSGETTRQWYTRDGSALNDQNSGGEGYVNHAGRVGCQMGMIYNFLGHTYDATFLDDFRHMFNHVFSRYVLLLEDNGTEYGFLSYNPLDGASPLEVNQWWMSALYTLHNLYIFYNEYGDQTLGSSNLPISRVFQGVGNSFKDYAATICDGGTGPDSCEGRTGDGTWSGTWSNRAMVAYSGSKIGGSLAEVSPYHGNSDAVLYVPEKGMLASIMLRAGKMTGDSALTDFGLEGLYWVINDSMIGRNNNFTPDDGTRRGASTDTWSKVNGELFARLRHAVAYIDSTFVIVTTRLPDATLGEGYFRSLTAGGGTAPYINWAIISGTLPDGLILDSDNREISGTPTSEGVFDFTVQATDSASPNATATRALQITVTSPRQGSDNTESGDSGGSGGSNGCFIENLF